MLGVAPCLLFFVLYVTNLEHFKTLAHEALHYVNIYLQDRTICEAASDAIFCTKSKRDHR